MMYMWNTLLLIALMSLLPGLSRAQDIRGQWQVRSTSERTQTYDGKETFKGPFTTQPKGNTLRIDDSTFVETMDTGKVTYKLQKSGTDYILTRQEDKEGITIRLTNVKKANGTLTFTSTRLNAPRNERYVVQWTCVPLKAKNLVPTSLGGTKWELVEIRYSNGKIVPPALGEQMTAVFEKNSVSGKAGVNRFTGPYKVTRNGSLTFREFVTTLIAVPAESIATIYLRNLKSANRYRFDKEGFLILQMPGNAGVLKFRKIVK